MKRNLFVLLTITMLSTPALAFNFIGPSTFDVQVETTGYTLTAMDCQAVQGGYWMEPDDNHEGEFTFTNCASYEQAWTYQPQTSPATGDHYLGVLFSNSRYTFRNCAFTGLYHNYQGTIIQLFCEDG